MPSPKARDTTGTTASVLHAGKPHVVVPHIADQGFFSHEVRRLGCGIKIAKRSWPENLAGAIARIKGDPSFQQHASTAKAVLHTENGPKTAVDEIERFVQDGFTADDTI